ncbi:MAG: hypothetical protein IBX69_07025 [Anaerolineales bacterium]|nr:hypothetical protein [Anaerolineales bacterium]
MIIHANFAGCHPYLADGNPQQLLGALCFCEKFDTEHFVLSHGPVGSRQGVTGLIENVEHCLETTQRRVL